MTLINVTLNNVFTSSKSDEVQQLFGSFDVSETTRNGRRKVTMLSDNSTYWVDEKEIECYDETVQSSPPTITIDEIVNDTEKLNSPIDRTVTYTVKRGDTITTIANEFNVTEASLKNLNGTFKFAIGQTIRIK